MPSQRSSENVRSAPYVATHFYFSVESWRQETSRVHLPKNCSCLSSIKFSCEEREEERDVRGGHGGMHLSYSAFLCRLLNP